MQDQGILTEKDLEEVERRLQDVFVTKEEFTKYRGELMDKLDRILKEILTSREEQTVLVHQTATQRKRISVLEKIISTRS